MLNSFLIFDLGYTGTPSEEATDTGYPTAASARSACHELCDDPRGDSSACVPEYGASHWPTVLEAFERERSLKLPRTEIGDTWRETIGCDMCAKNAQV